MVAEDLRTREELAENGSLYGAYHPRMQQVHQRNAARLLEILDEHGWPGRSLVGKVEDSSMAPNSIGTSTA